MNLTIFPGFCHIHLWILGYDWLLTAAYPLIHPNLLVFDPKLRLRTTHPTLEISSRCTAFWRFGPMAAPQRQQPNNIQLLYVTLMNGIPKIMGCFFWIPMSLWTWIDDHQSVYSNLTMVGTAELRPASFEMATSSTNGVTMCNCVTSHGLWHLPVIGISVLKLGKR